MLGAGVVERAVLAGPFWPPRVLQHSSHSFRVTLSLRYYMSCVLAPVDCCAQPHLIAKSSGHAQRHGRRRVSSRWASPVAHKARNAGGTTGRSRRTASQLTIAAPSSAKRARTRSSAASAASFSPDRVRTSKQRLDLTKLLAQLRFIRHQQLAQSADVIEHR